MCQTRHISDQDFERDFEGTRSRRITRSIEHTSAAQINMEKEGLCRPVSSLDSWDLLVWRQRANSACVNFRSSLIARSVRPKARVNSSELLYFSRFLRDRLRVT